MLTNNLTPAAYDEQMSGLRQELSGQRYCKAVQNLLPEVSKATIHGAFNGRNRNEFVLAALKIVAFQLKKSEQQLQKVLTEAAEQLGVTV